ncbi:MAG: hypothetical protein WC613_04405 [Candidatus Aenigmatarchaeota archaeon]
MEFEEQFHRRAERVKEKLSCVKYKIAIMNGVNLKNFEAIVSNLEKYLLNKN